MFSKKDPISTTQNPHWELLRDLIKFQAKLLADWLRDILLSPLSIVAAVAGMILNQKEPQTLFQLLMGVGRRSERWINLFSRADQDIERQEPGIDELFEKLEQQIVRQYHQGGATASAKHAIDRSLDGLHRGLDRLKGLSNDRDNGPGTD